jgi:type IV pilus assembly protein PilC
MAMLTPSATAPIAGAKPKPKGATFAERQQIARQKAYERQSRRKRIKLQEITVFTQQLSSMLSAGLSLVSSLEALMDQTENPVFKIILRDVRNDISGGTTFSAAVRKFPNAFPNLFISMVEAGEASGALADIMGKVSMYFEDSLKLQKKVKSAMTYPATVICMACGLVSILMIKVIPVFEQMFKDFGNAKLPAPTLFLIAISDFMQAWWWAIAAGLYGGFQLYKRVTATPKGRAIKHRVVSKLPIVGNLSRKINISRFCRTYAILLKSGVPILRAIEICSKASDSIFIEQACTEINRTISSGGQLSDCLATQSYFPSTVRHMARAGEQTGNVDGMMNKVSDFYDNEIDNIVGALTSLMEPLLICFLGVVVGGIVIAMFMPIFMLSSVAGNG